METSTFPAAEASERRAGAKGVWVLGRLRKAEGGYRPDVGGEWRHAWARGSPMGVSKNSAGSKVDGDAVRRRATMASCSTCGAVS